MQGDKKGVCKHNGEVSQYSDPLFYWQHSITIARMGRGSRSMSVFSYEFLACWPVWWLLRGRSAWIHARHLVQYRASLQTKVSCCPHFVGCTPHLHTMTMLEAGTVWQTNPRKGEAVLTFWCRIHGIMLCPSSSTACSLQSWIASRTPCGACGYRNS